MSKDKKDEPAFGKAALVRLATIPLMALVVAGFVGTLFIYAKVDFEILWTALIYIVIIAAPITFLAFLVWGKAGQMDGTWGR